VEGLWHGPQKVFGEMVCDLLVPAIVEKWPRGEWADPNFKIKILQDGAGGHAPAKDATLRMKSRDWRRLK
jgi:hypothetical protein